MTPQRLLTPQARRDLDDAIGWILDQGATTERAERLVIAVLTAAERLARRPHLGRRRPDLLPDPYRFWSLPRQRLVLAYKPDRGVVAVLRVLSTDRDLAPLLAGIAGPAIEP